MDTKIDKLISIFIQTAKYIHHNADQSFEERAATMLQYHTLGYLKSNPGSKLGEVAKYLHASLSSTTQLIERLHKSGFVTREEDTKDRRITHLYVTKEGIEKLKAIKQHKRNRMKKMLSHMSEEELDQLITIHEKLLQSIRTETK